MRLGRENKPAINSRMLNERLGNVTEDIHPHKLQILYRRVLHSTIKDNKACLNNNAKSQSCKSHIHENSIILTNSNFSSEFDDMNSLKEGVNILCASHLSTPRLVSRSSQTKTISRPIICDCPPNKNYARWVRYLNDRASARHWGLVR